MPDFTFIGASPGMYPMLRDVYGVPAGTVTPGDVLEFSEAPDGDWVPYEGDRGGIESTPDPADVRSEQDDNTAGQSGSEES